MNNMIIYFPIWLMKYILERQNDFFQDHVDYKAMIKMRETPSLETLIKCNLPSNYFLFFHRFIMVEREKDRDREREKKKKEKTEINYNPTIRYK